MNANFPFLALHYLEKSWDFSKIALGQFLKLFKACIFEGVTELFYRNRAESAIQRVLWFRGLAASDCF